MNSIILDTSSILFGFENRKNIFEIALKQWHGCKLLMPNCIIYELEKRALNSGKKGAFARAALTALRSAPVVPIKSNSNADSWIADNAPRRGALVVTNDTMLAKKLLSLNVAVFKLSRNGNLHAFYC